MQTKSVSNMPSQHIWNRLLVAYMAYIDVCQHNAVIYQPKGCQTTSIQCAPYRLHAIFTRSHYRRRSSLCMTLCCAVPRKEEKKKYRLQLVHNSLIFVASTAHLEQTATSIYGIYRCVPTERLLMKAARLLPLIVYSLSESGGHETMFVDRV